MSNPPELQTIPRYQGTCALWMVVLIFAVGCRNPYMPPSPYGMPPSMPGGMPAAGYPAQPFPYMGQAAAYPQNQFAPQMAEVQRRLEQLDENNRQLTSQLAQAQQQTQALRERNELYTRQLADQAAQYRQLLATTQQYANQAQGMQASMTARGGAKLTANNSLANSAANLSVAGANVIPDGELIRIRFSADQLFSPGTAQLNVASASMLDQLSSVITRQYPRQRVAIEGHTDSNSTIGNSSSAPYQLAGAQAQAVLDQLVRRNGVPQQQLFAVAHGPNHPIAENQTPAGRAENRRLEVVIYPETY
jgi:flagellar motor protein MotB